MKVLRPPLFRKRKFEPMVIVTCVRWYCRFALSLRDLEEFMAERGLSVDHTTIWRWTQTYGAEVYRRLRGEVKRKSCTWHMDETFVRIAGKWMYLFRAVDSQGQTVDFYLSETRDRELPRCSYAKPLPIPTIVRRTCWSETACAAIPPPFENSRNKDNHATRVARALAVTANNRIESDHRHMKRRLRAMQGPRTAATVLAVIQGIEAAQIIGKGQVLGITRSNPQGQAWVFRSLLGVA